MGLNSKATSFADSIDKMFGISSPKSHTSLDSYVSKCMHLTESKSSLKESLSILWALTRTSVKWSFVLISTLAFYTNPI